MMVLGKLCLILVCTNSYAQSWETPVYQNWQRTDSIVGFAFNVTKWFTKRLKPEDQAMHSQSVYTYPGSGNICRRIHSWVRFGADEKSFQDTACYNNTTNTWIFIDKY